MPIPSYRLRLSAQRALLGNVSTKLRAVCVKTENQEIHVIFYYDGEILEEENELAESTMDDIISDFHIDDEGNDMKFFTSILRVDYPNKMPLFGEWVFYRKED